MANETQAADLLTADLIEDFRNYFTNQLTCITAWKNIAAIAGSTENTHDVYLKLLSFSAETIERGFILIDELESAYQKNKALLSKS